MRRRQFVSFLGGAAVWPLATRAQQQAMPTIGWLSGIPEQAAVAHHAQFLRGLKESGFSPGRNVAIQYRWAEGQYGRLPALASELIGLPVDVLVAQTPPAALAAKAATTTIPIVFVIGIDPVAAGLVASYNRPGGNATGATMIMGQLGQKRVEILRELVPAASVVAMLINPHSPDTAPELREGQAAITASGLQLRLLNASTPPELGAALSALNAQRPDAVLIGADPFLYVQRKNIVDHIARRGLVAVYPIREFVEAGGLISYGGNIANSFRQAGIYTGRILMGAKPSDLPVVQPNTFGGQPQSRQGAGHRHSAEFARSIGRSHRLKETACITGGATRARSISVPNPQERLRQSLVRDHFFLNRGSPQRLLPLEKGGRFARQASWLLARS